MSQSIHHREGFVKHERGKFWVVVHGGVGEGNSGNSRNSPCHPFDRLRASSVTLLFLQEFPMGLWHIKRDENAAIIFIPYPCSFPSVFPISVAIFV